MLTSVLVLLILSLGVKGDDVITLGNCVCNQDNSVCGLVVSLSTDSVTVFTASGQTTLPMAVSEQRDQVTCNFNVLGGTCMCALVDTFFYGFQATGPIPVRPVNAGECYEAAGFGVTVDESDIYEFADDTVPVPSIFNLLNRDDTFPDLTGAGCVIPPDCPTEPVPDSPSCSTVFPEEAIITKGQFKDRCYYGVNQRTRYNEAREFCEGVGLNLVWVETEEEGAIVSEITGFDAYFIGLERPLFSSSWFWVSSDIDVNADSDVDGRFQGPSFNRNFARAIVKMNDAGEFPLKLTNRRAKKKFVCEETVICTVTEP